MEVYGKMAAPFDTGLTGKNKLVTELEKAEREEREALELMARSRAKIALLKANTDIERLRRERDAVEALEEAKYDTEINRLIALRHDVRVKREALRRGERDSELTAVSVARAADFVVADRQPVVRVRPEGGPVRVRKGVIRPALAGLIKSRTLFRYKFKGVEYGCYSDTGAVFCDTASTDTYDTLAEFCDKKIKASGDTTGTTVSAYEKVYVKLNNCPSGDPWRKWGDIYHISTTQIN